MAAEHRVIRSEVKGGIIGFFGTQSGFSYNLLAASGKGVLIFPSFQIPCCLAIVRTDGIVSSQSSISITSDYTGYPQDRGPIYLGNYGTYTEC